jgi:TRAP-type C4-dicarboxylate transport system permease small subunit
MLKVLNRIIKVGDRIYVSIGVLLLATLVITVSIGVFARYVFNSPFDWTEELVTVIFIWISFLGAAVASARHKHVVVDIFTAKASPHVRNLIGIVSDLLTMLFLAMVIIGAVILLPTMLHTSVALNIPRWVYYIPVLASSVLIFLVHLVSIIQETKILSGKSNTEAAS